METFEIDNEPKKRTLIQKGYKEFINTQYKKALGFFSDALFLDKDDLNAKIGVLLSDIAMDFPKEAYNFYELYQNLLSAQPRSQRTKVQKQVLEILKCFDADLNKMSDAISTQDRIKVDSIDGIPYRDFKEMCEKRDFKEVFENLMFSTKIIFTDKNDFCDFLDLLVENDFYEMSINYIENMRSFTLYDKKINKILQKAVQKQSENSKTN